MKARTILVIVFLQRVSVLMMDQNTIKTEKSITGIEKTVPKALAHCWGTLHSRVGFSTVFPEFAQQMSGTSK